MSKSQLLGKPTHNITFRKSGGCAAFLPAASHRPFSLSFEGELTVGEALKLSNWIARCCNEFHRGSNGV